MFIFTFTATLLVIVSSFYIIRRLYLVHKPKVYVNPETRLAKILNSLNVLKVGYRPTPWLLNKHIHTIWGMKFRGRSNFQPRRDTIFFKDGGQVTLDWFEEKNLSHDASIIFVVHTLGGGTREPCTNHFCMTAMHKGYRVLVCTCRGCNGSKLTSKRIYNGYQTDDLHSTIIHALKQFPDAKHKYLIGFSLGSMIAKQYSIDYDDVESIVCVSHPVETEKTLEILAKPLEKRLYYKSIMKALHHCINKSSFYVGEEREKALRADNLRDFDTIVTAKNLGLNSAQEYYNLIRLEKNIDKIKIPIVFLNSEDDPFTDSSFYPYNNIIQTKFCAFVTTPEGGHVSFCEGFNGKSSYIEDFTLEFFEKFSSFD